MIPSVTIPSQTDSRLPLATATPSTPGTRPGSRPTRRRASRVQVLTFPPPPRASDEPPVEARPVSSRPPPPALFALAQTTWGASRRVVLFGVLALLFAVGSVVVALSG